MATGRPPKPTKLKILAGNPGKRKLNTAEPEPPEYKRPPPPPRTLGKAGRREWVRVAKWAHRLGLLTRADYRTLELYCSSYEDWLLAYKDCKANGWTYRTYDEGGGIKFAGKRPEALLVREAYERVLRFGVEFGLTPASRSRVKATPRDSADDSGGGFFTDTG